MARIVITDNFNRDEHDEYWVNVGPLSDEDAQKIVDILTQDKYYPAAGYNPNFYKVVPNDYKLYKFEP